MKEPRNKGGKKGRRHQIMGSIKIMMRSRIKTFRTLIYSIFQLMAVFQLHLWAIICSNDYWILREETCVMNILNTSHKNYLCKRHWYVKTILWFNLKLVKCPLAKMFFKIVLCFNFKLNELWNILEFW